MNDLIQKLTNRLPLDFRVLYGQFLLRVIDLETLSIQADVLGFLGQFAGVLFMLSMVHSVVTYVGFVAIHDANERLAFFLHMEHYQIATMMLVVGLFTVLSWDATFPDRRDVMVLAPLPVASRTILAAKVSASLGILAVAVFTLNFASGFVVPFLLSAQAGALMNFFRFFSAWWLTLIGASAFLYCSVLTIQGLTALLLPRRLFLRVTAFLQLAAFGLFLGVYFVQPTLTAPVTMAAQENQWILAISPSYWFFALFNQMSGVLQPQFAWLAVRAGLGVGLAIAGAAASLLLCYVRTMKKTIEQPDLVPGGSGFDWAPRLGNSLRSAIAMFSVRSLTRSRQHRVAFAFYLAFVLGIALSLGRNERAAHAPLPISTEFLFSTLLMVFFAVAGLRNVFSLPISLTANWVLRTTQLRPTQDYVAATRQTLLLLGVLPAWLLAAALAYGFTPHRLVGAHLVLLALMGGILVELALINFYKVPFTCSYLPGKTNFQYAFWGFLLALILVVRPFVDFELRALHDASRYGFLFCISVGLIAALVAYNHHEAKSAVLYFEELPEEPITTLKLSA